MRPVTFVTWLWTGATMGKERVEYIADHVNRCASMIRRNCTLPHEIVCVTDVPEGIDSSIRIVPMWPDLCEYGKCYRRLKVFDPAMRDILGPRIVSIDLDVVITGNIDHLFKRDEPFVIWGDRLVTNIANKTAYCGSLWMLDIGYRPDIFHDFDPQEALNLRETEKLIGSDQAWMSHKIKGAPTWGRKDGVYSFRLDIMAQFGQPKKGFGMRAAKVPKRTGELPENARCVFFHGVHDPSLTHLHPQYPWIKHFWK